MRNRDKTLIGIAIAAITLTGVSIIRLLQKPIDFPKTLTNAWEEPYPKVKAPRPIPS